MFSKLRKEEWNKLLLRQELDEQLEKEEGEEGFKMSDKLAKTYIFEIEGGKGKKTCLSIQPHMIRPIQIISSENVIMNYYNEFGQEPNPQVFNAHWQSVVKTTQLES